MRRSHRKGDDKVTHSTSKLSTDVTVDCSQSCDVFKSNIVDQLYSTINPGDSDVPITTNPSYNVYTKPYNKTSEDEYNYIYNLMSICSIQISMILLRWTLIHHMV